MCELQLRHSTLMRCGIPVPAPAPGRRTTPARACRRESLVDSYGEYTSSSEYSLSDSDSSESQSPPPPSIRKRRGRSCGPAFKAEERASVTPAKRSRSQKPTSEEATVTATETHRNENECEDPEFGLHLSCRHSSTSTEPTTETITSPEHKVFSPEAPPAPTDTEETEDLRRNSHDSGIGSLSLLEIPSSADPEHKEHQKFLLNGLLEELMKIPESLPFRHEVADSPSNSNPGRFSSSARTRHRSGMNLNIIREKFDQGKYDDPWDFISDINQIFKNASGSNSRMSKVFRSSVQLSQRFDKEMDRIMRELGFCCGKHQVITPQKLICSGKESCMIEVGGTYYKHPNELPARYLYCRKCYKTLGDEVELPGTDGTKTAMIVKKNDFDEKKNNETEIEPFVNCVKCSKRFHQMCVLHYEKISPNGFCCEKCFWTTMPDHNARHERSYNARDLPTSKLSDFIQQRVNQFLINEQVPNCELVVRVAGTFQRKMVVNPEVKQFYVEEGKPSVFPYKCKTIFVFQKIDGIDVCIFGFIVHEYGSECPEPNRRRINLAYLDSVQFFQPRPFRTLVFQEILLSYFAYVKTLGFEVVHIWACPPTEGDDYIFHRHPVEQKVPTLKRLCAWYRNLLEKGKEKGIVVDYKNYIEEVQGGRINSLTQIPYFDGDHWPAKLEELIKEVKKERDKYKPEMSSVNADKTLNPNKMKKKAKNPKRDSTMTLCALSLHEHIWKVVTDEMKKHKDVFFNVRLQSADSSPPEVIDDPDILRYCTLLESRYSLLTMARDSHFEFTTLRRAKYLTLVILFYLHPSDEDISEYWCDQCKNGIKRHHCLACGTDYCVKCFKEANCCSNPNWDKIGSDELQGNFEYVLHLLDHAVKCNWSSCSIVGCTKLKYVLSHLPQCSKKGSFATPTFCEMCHESMTIICEHAQRCTEVWCGVLYCGNIKMHLKEAKRFKEDIEEPVEHNNQMDENIASCSRYCLNF